MFIKNIFNRSPKKKPTVYASVQRTSKESIPRPEVIKKCYDKGLEFIHPVVKVIYTDAKSERAVILQNPDMTYTVRYEKLYPFSDEEIEFLSLEVPGFWSLQDGNSIYDTAEKATDEVLLAPPFKYNKCVVWADTPFRVDADRLYWIKDDGADDPDDFCLHGNVMVKLGEEFFEYGATVSAAGLYLLRTLTENHLIREGEAMLPCCGHFMIANEDLSAVGIYCCPNGLDWSVTHENGSVKLITKTEKETLIDIDVYRDEVYAFADKIEAFYKNSAAKNLSGTDTFLRDGYIAFWNEWNRRRQLAKYRY